MPALQSNSVLGFPGNTERKFVPTHPMKNKSTALVPYDSDANRAPVTSPSMRRGKDVKKKGGDGDGESGRGSTGGSGKNSKTTSNFKGKDKDLEQSSGGKKNKKGVSVFF